MKIIKKYLKHGIITIRTDNPDDVWNLDSVIEAGDVISGKSLRSGEILRGDQKIKTGKKPIFLKILLEKKEYHEYTGKLRLTGKIIDGPEDLIGSYHTLEVGEGKVITIEKQWKNWQLEKIKRSLKKQPTILVCALDERNATIAEVREKTKVISEIANRKAGKEFGQSDNKEYFSEIIQVLKRRIDSVDKIIIAGPGFTKEYLIKEIKVKWPEAEGKIIQESCSHSGIVGISEVIRRGAIERVSKESRISEETKIVEEFLKELSKDGLVTYGKKEVEKALKAGAVKDLIITERKVRDNENLLNLAEKTNSKIHIISENHDAGIKLENLGGIAAFLRFKVDLSA